MLLIRHAQSEWNLHFGRTRIDPGIPDPALTEAGRRQAAMAAERLAQADVAVVLCSPYRRCLQTAEAIAGRTGAAIQVDPLVRERCAFSCDQGSSPAELARLWPDLDFSHLEEVWWGGVIESWLSLEARCAAFRRTLSAAHDRHEIAVVSHWGFIRGLTGAELHNTGFIRLDPIEAAPLS
jgi:broad specificity phosphatase PhoE